MGLREIREGLAANLAAIPDLGESAYLRSRQTYPSAEIEPGKIDYDTAFGRGGDESRLIVRVEVGTPTDIGAQINLDRFLAPSGDYSVKAALEADKTLGGASYDLDVKDCSGYRVFRREGRPSTLGAEWTVVVWAEPD